MKLSFLRIVAFILMLIMLLASCAPAAVPSETEDTADEVELEIYLEREDKEVKNILMIGNSFCYYYVEELCGIAKADGYELNVVNLYKSGARLNEHYESYIKDEKIGDLYVTNHQQRKRVGTYSFKEALEYAKEKLGGDFDVITLQQSSAYTRSLNSTQKAKDATLPYARKLYDYIRETHPGVTLYWHQTWAYEIGYDKDASNAVTTVEKQTEMYEAARDLAYVVAKETGVRIVPSGDAWQIARESEIIGHDLCRRLEVNNGEGDYYHDGDIGGGQYLNACVWYEVLMGESCVGNTWRPKNYTLPEEKIAVIQAAAHEAVAAVYGPGYAQ